MRQQTASSVRTGVWILVVVLCLAIGAGTAAAAGADAPPVIDAAQSDEEPTEASGSTLTATSAGSSLTISAADSGSTYGDQEVAITVAPTGASFSPEGTMPIYVGAVNNSAENSPIGESNIELTITVTQPDGKTEEFTRTTDSDGSAKVDYSLDGAQEGTYAVSVSGYDSSQTATVYPTVGPAVSEIEDFGKIPVEKDTDIDFVVRSGTESVANELVNISVEAPNGTVIDQRQEQSDANGFVTVPFSPAETGSYDFNAKVADSSSQAPEYELQAGISVDVSEVVVRNGYRLDGGIAGKAFSYGGYVKDVDGFIRNTDFTVELVNTTDYDDESTVATRQVTTGSNGFFTVDFTADQNAERYEVVVTNTDGTQVDSENIYLDGTDDDDAAEDDVEIDVEADEDTVAPGEEITYEISATANDEPITNAPVTVLGRLDFNGAPVASETLTTDSSGSTGLTVEAPQRVNGTDIDGEVKVQYNGTRYSESLPYTDIETYDLDPDLGYDQDDTAGGTAEFRWTVEEVRTGDPVSGVPMQFNALYEDNAYESFERGELVTGDDGTASQTVSVPRDVGPVPAVEYTARGDQPTYVNMYEFPGSMSIDGVEQDAAAPGETLTVDFNTPNDQPTSGIVIAEFEDSTTDDDAQTAVAKSISTSSTATIEVPEWAANTDAEIEVWTADSEERFYDDREYFDIESGGSDPGGETTVPDGLSDTLTAAQFNGIDDNGDGIPQLSELVTANIERINNGGTIEGSNGSSVELSLGELVETNLWRINNT